jgi:hypothetical protein
MDARWRPTLEVLPSIGADLMLVTIPSYFREPAAFQVEIDVPAGKRCTGIRELVNDKTVTPTRDVAGRIDLDIVLSPDDFLQVYAIELA